MDVPDANSQPEDTDKILWEGPPPLPDPATVVNDLSCQGTIAIALREALFDIHQETMATKAVEIGVNHDASDNHEASQQSEVDGSRSSSNVPLSPRIDLSQQNVDQIMRSFGEAVTQSQCDQRELDANKQQRSGDRADAAGAAAPAAVLRGRIDHYNRFGAKWRFMVHDAEILPRRALDRNRRKRERPSLWQLAAQQQEPSVKIQRLEILVYDDIE
jgi:hypothetical protein